MSVLQDGEETYTKVEVGSRKQKSTVIISFGTHDLAALLIACLLLKKRGRDMP